MSNLVTITAKFYDKSGQSFGHLDVQSRYQGSSKANTQKADSNGATAALAAWPVCG